MSATKIKAWHFGNTSVRSPFRLRDGLIALSTSSLQGNLRGREQDKAWRDLLGDAEIVTLGIDETNSVGRKWRSALEKLGFLYPEVSEGISQAELGKVDTITPNGWRLVQAENVPAMQECFLRSIAAHHIPSPQEPEYDFPVFSPLKHVLKIMIELGNKTGDTKLNFLEMALVVQFSDTRNAISEVVEKVLDLRQRKEKASNKRQFDSEEFESAAIRVNYKSGTFRDYADLNFRYLKATGLFQTRGRGISIVPEKLVFIEELVQDTAIPAFDISYYRALCDGAKLPTDEKSSAIIVLNDLVQQVNKRGIAFDLSKYKSDTPADISQVRHVIEQLIAQDNEMNYAKEQANQLEEIEAYIDLIITKKDSKTLSNGEKIDIPKSEAPAYLEWILWRSFLAINHLQNKPYEARRFKVDQDFLPVGCAPGGGPDMIFEFEDLILIVEVTLTASSRQEAAEGEPVRRHVAYYAEKFEKPVFGLFIALAIDSNTAHTFRYGDWFLADDSKKSLDIVPVTLSDFRDFFLSGASRLDQMPQRLRQLLIECRAKANQDAPQWKAAISSIIKDSCLKNKGNSDDKKA